MEKQHALKILNALANGVHSSIGVALVNRNEFSAKAEANNSYINFFVWHINGFTCGVLYISKKSFFNI